MKRILSVLLAVLLLGAGEGCVHCFRRPEITCYSASNPCEPEGIPYYLPKPLLIVSKNFRYIQDGGEGKSMGAAPIPGDKFDNQATYADLKANVSTSSSGGTSASKSEGAGGADAKGKQQTGSQSTPDTALTNNAGVVPPGTFKDGVTPDTFYTYQVVFVPDMTQKYVMKLKGGAGEFRAAMNMVNGWMFTGLGPFYLKDSSTAQNIMAFGGAITLAGRGVADVVSSIADLKKAAGGGKPQTGALEADVADRMTEIKMLMDRNGLHLEPIVIPQFADIKIYEASVVDGQMEWRPIVNESYSRTILGVVTKTSTTPKEKMTEKPAEKPDTKTQPGQSQPGQSQPGQSQPGQPPKGGGKPEAGIPSLDNSGAYLAPSRLETALTNRIESAAANRVADGFVGGPYGNAPYTDGVAQAGELGGTGGGNKVVVNVNPPKQKPLCRLRSCFKSKHHKIEQHTIDGADEDAVAVTGGNPGQGAARIPGAQPGAVTSVSKP